MSSAVIMKMVRDVVSAFTNMDRPVYKPRLTASEDSTPAVKHSYLSKQARIRELFGSDSDSD